MAVLLVAKTLLTTPSVVVPLIVSTLIMILIVVFVIYGDSGSDLGDWSKGFISLALLTVANAGVILAMRKGYCSTIDKRLRDDAGCSIDGLIKRAFTENITSHVEVIDGKSATRDNPPSSSHQVYIAPSTVSPAGSSGNLGAAPAPDTTPGFGGHSPTPPVSLSNISSANISAVKLSSY